MKQKILNHTSIMIILTVLLTFVAASFVMYGKFDSVMKTGVRNEAEYVKVGLEEAGTIYLNEKVGQATDTRITLTDKDGNVLYDSEADASLLPNHSDRPEFIQAMESGQGEIVRYSETLARQTFYYAVKLSDGRILRLAKTTDSVFHTLMTSFTLLGLLMVLIILVEYVLAQQQTKSLIEPINNLNLERPLDNVCYEELRPLLVRVDQQNKQIASQLEELKKVQGIEFIEMDSDKVLVPGELEKEAAAIVAHCSQQIAKGITCCVSTKRVVLTLPDDTPEAALVRSVAISDALQSCVGRLTASPAFVVAKGGITSSDVGVKALRVKCAKVLGQIRPGIPVWQTGAESLFPGTPYIIFPGNVGEVSTLREAVEILLG